MKTIPFPSDEITEALLQIRRYAQDHSITGEEIIELFSAGVSAAGVLGAPQIRNVPKFQNVDGELVSIANTASRVS